MDTKKLLQFVIGGSVATVVLVLAWRSDPVQETLRPEKYWTDKALLIELDVESLRAKVADCAVSAQKSGVASTKAGADTAATGTRSETVAKLCSSYDEDLKAAVESLLAAKKKLKDARG